MVRSFCIFKSFLPITETMRAAKSEYTHYSLLVETLMILSVGVLEELRKRSHHAMKESMLS